MQFKNELILWKIGFSIIFILFCVLVFIIGYFYFYPTFYFSSKDKSEVLLNADITYDALSDREREEIDIILYDLKPEYLILAKDITFTTNQTLLYEQRTQVNYSENLAGLNKGGKILILYTDFLTTKEILCHELLHSLITIYEEEWYVKDIAKTEVCYE